MLLLSVNSYSAGSSDNSILKLKQNDKAVAHIKLAKKYEKKDK